MAATGRRYETSEAEEIEITPEMIEAGLGELLLSEPHDSRESIIEDVYSAMEIARRELRRSTPASTGCPLRESRR
jgi:hypothetical protein